MTAPVVWEPTLAALDAALEALPLSIGIRRQGENIATRLRSAGTSYDLRYTPPVQLQRERELADFHTRKAAEIERARPTFESIDAEARALDPLTNAAIPLAYSPETATASANLGSLRVTALEAGRFGNAIVVSVGVSSMENAIKGMVPPLYTNFVEAYEASTMTEEEKEEAINSILGARALAYAAAETTFSLRVARGNQVEDFPSVHPGTAPARSELVRFETLSSARPVGRPLRGGAGGEFAALSARLGRVAAAHGATRVASLRARLVRVTPRSEQPYHSAPFGGPKQGTGKIVQYPSGPVGIGVTLPSIEGVEDELVTAIGEAEAWLAA